jgi:hypothetical protein
MAKRIARLIDRAMAAPRSAVSWVHEDVPMRCRAQRSQEQIMAVRVVALLIPLAITLPQLQTNIDPAPPVHEPAVQAQQAPWPQWSYDTRRATGAAFTRVELESPLYSAVHTIASPATDPEPLVAAKPALRKAQAQRVVHAPARPANTKALERPVARHISRPTLQAVSVCPPQAHCAPVVVARQTPVPRRSM